MKKNLLIIIFLHLSIYLVSAQNYFGLLHPNQNTVNFGVNANPGLNLNSDFMYFLPEESAESNLGFLVSINVPLVTKQGLNFDIRYGGGYLWTIENNFKVICGAGMVVSRTSDLNGKYWNIGFKTDFYPGFYGKRWAIAPHLSWDYKPLVHIKHSEYAQQAFEDLYPDGAGKYNAPKDGWFYQSEYNIFQLGLGAAYHKEKWNVNLTAGFQYIPNRLKIVMLPDIGLMPFYGSLNFGYVLENKP